MGITELKEAYIPKGERKREGKGVKNGYYRDKRRIYTKRRERKRTERCWKWVYIRIENSYIPKSVLVKNAKDVQSMKIRIRVNKDT